MHVLCTLMLVFLVWSQRPLFYGLDTDLFRSSLRSSSSQSKSLERARTHSGANELGYGSQIKGMLETESYLVVIFMQTRLRPHGMPEEEKKRWTTRGDEPSTGCFRRWCCRCCSLRNFLVLTLYIGLPLGIVIVALGSSLAVMRNLSEDFPNSGFVKSLISTDFNRIYKVIKAIYIFLPTVLCFVLEANIRRNRHRYMPASTSTVGAGELDLELATRPGRRVRGEGGGGRETGAGDVALNPVVKAAALGDVKPHIARAEVFKAEAKRNMKESKRGARGKRSERSGAERKERGNDDTQV
mmetsp:Transcript_11383/g.23055  ORF Transcript_11383/g.23055 Transcript_11383/m.23055 type:complete len:298 (-) Transcript_11383:41-934(-)